MPRARDLALNLAFSPALLAIGCGGDGTAAVGDLGTGTGPDPLPDPVRALPQMSLPASASGMVSDWMGDGTVILDAASTLITAGPTPRAPNVVPSASSPVTGRAAAVTAGTCEGAAGLAGRGVR